MADLGTLVSGPADFANLKVYRRNEPGGPVFTIRFKNREVMSDTRALMYMAPIALSSIGFLWAALDESEYFEMWLIFLLIAVPVSLILALRPYKPLRDIEVNFADDRFRVKRNGKLQWERNLSRVDNLTVEEHPDAEVERQQRQGSGNNTISNAERQHCLIGWFGAEGSERVDLFCRLEWPNRSSLFEVRQAVQWAMKQAQRSPEIAPGEGTERPGSGGMKPPLD